MTQDKAALKERLGQLKVAFAEKLSSRLVEIDRAAVAFLATATEADARPRLEVLRGLAHKLAGSAGTFGYPQVGEDARALEHLCLPLLDGIASADADWRDQATALLKRLHEGAGQHPDEAAAAEIPPPAGSTGGERRSILLVEDNMELARLLQFQLGNFGFDVHLLPSPAALETAVVNLQPAAIVMDIIFDVDDKAGLAAIRHLRERGVVICPVIYLSVRDDFDARLEAVRNGGDAYLVKPPRILDLVAVLGRVVERSQIVPYRVLIVDDDAEMVEMLSLHLREAGMTCQGVVDPRRALDALADFQPDVIVLDVHMPGVSGIELAMMIRELPAPYFRIPIIFATSARSDANKLLTVRAGGDDLIPKPVDMSLLIASVLARAERSRTVTTLTRQQADQEEQFHAVAQSAPDAIVSLDDNGIVTFWNGAAERLFGYAANDILGWPFLRLVPAGMRDTVRETLNSQGSSWRRGPTYGVLDLICLARNGREFEAEASVSVWRRNDHKAFTLQLRDVTERKRRDEALRAACANAQRASEAKTRFLSAISHELRTPLNAILGFAQILESDPKEPLKERQLAQLAQIQRAGRRLLGLIEEVLDLADIESGRLDLDLADVDPRRLAAECLEEIADQAEAQKVTVENRLAAEPWPLIRIDRQRAGQILHNLLSNAVKYNREGGSLWLEGQVTEAGMLRLSVGDTGPGIPAALHDRLFQPFERLNERHRSQGSGIGLALTRQLAERMGGAVGFASTEGQGSVFWVDFPFA